MEGSTYNTRCGTGGEADIGLPLTLFTSFVEAELLDIGARVAGPVIADVICGLVERAVIVWSSLKLEVIGAVSDESVRNVVAEGVGGVVQELVTHLGEGVTKVCAGTDTVDEARAVDEFVDHGIEGVDLRIIEEAGEDDFLDGGQEKGAVVK